MKKETKLYTQMSLIIRLMAGGYLLYTAWDLREAIAENPLFIIAIVAFAVIGLFFAVQAGWKLYKGEYEGGPADVKPANEEETEEEEEEEETEETENEEELA